MPREYSAKAKRKYRAKRDQRLKQVYGITTQQWDRLFELQGCKCPICLQSLRKPGNKEGKRAASVDHDHATGRVRGLLSYRCNKSLVGANTLATAQRMVMYLGSDVDGRLL